MASYSISDVICTLGATTIGAFGVDGGIEYEPANENDGEYIIGASGFPTWVEDTNNLVIAVITVPPGSLTSRLLWEQYKAQRLAANNGVFLPYPYYMFDPRNGDTVRDGKGMIMSAPMPNKVKTLTDNIFRVGLPTAKSGREMGTFNVSDVF